MGIASNPHLLQFQMIRLDTRLAQKLHGTPIVLRMKRRLGGNQQRWDTLQINQLSRSRVVRPVVFDGIISRTKSLSGSVTTGEYAMGIFVNP